MKFIIRKAFIIVTLVCMACTLFLVDNTNNTMAESLSINPQVKIYEMAHNSYYRFSSSEQVESMTFGRKTLGTLTVSGEITDQTTYKQHQAYGCNGNLSFSYKYDGSFQTSIKENWNLISERGHIINDEISLTGSINKGALIIQTSPDGQTWTMKTNPITNFFGDNSSGVENFYTTEGADIAKGCYYRIIIAYKMGRKTGMGGFLNLEEIYERKEHVEIYEFYACLNSGKISIHDKSVTEDDLLNNEEWTSEQMKKGETLLNGSTTTKGFSIDKLGTSYLVNVKKDNGDGVYVRDGQEFTENGKYEIKTITNLGKQIVNTVYIFNGGEDNGFSTYFSGSSFLQNYRVFREGEYPHYAKGTYGQINAISEFVPILTGTITNKTTNQVIEIEKTREEQIFNFDVGVYSAEFFSGNVDAGSVYRYVFNFEIIDEDPGPYVNYKNLITKNEVEDLWAKHYEVAYQTTEGGYVFVCFALESYNEAFNYAYEIEKRFIEKTEDGLYYKSLDNPNLKVKYFDYIAMTEVINYYARKNVEINYFNAIDQYTFRTYEDDLLEKLESLNIKESIKVFPSAEEREKVSKRQLFINNFKFINVANYDVVSVEAYCYKNAQTYPLEFNIEVYKQLKISSKYLITETNAEGLKKQYDAYFVNENLTKSVWNVTVNGQTTKYEVRSDNLIENQIEITADSISIESIENTLDNGAIVAIKAPGVYSFEIKCLISELKNIALYKKGSYKLTFIDRLGNNYLLIINITGNTRYSDVINESTKSYTQFHNYLYVNQRLENEEIIYDVVALKVALDRDVNSTMYTAESYSNYMLYYNYALQVYQNQNSTQQEINNATVELETAYLQLEEIKNKENLLNELNKFQIVDKNLYTTQSYAALEIAYGQGLQIYQNQTASDEIVEVAINNLKEAYNNLILRGEKSLLDSKLEEAENINCELYTPNSLQLLQEAYNNAKLIKENKDALQEQINHAVEQLEQKIKSLVKIANFNELKLLIQEIKDIDLNKYTTITANGFKIKFNNAVTVCKDLNSSQAIVNNEINELNLAYENLVPCGNSIALKEEVEKTKNIVYMIYTKETIQPVLTAYNLAIEIISARCTQAEIDECLNNLKQLKTKLVIREDKQELYNLLMETAGIDTNGYTKETMDNLLQKYEDAKVILENLDATKEEVMSAHSQVAEAKEALEKEFPVIWTILIIVGIIGLIIAGIIGICFMFA